jgi:DNA-binding NtrC family response regulator
MTSFGSIDSAVRLMQSGAAEYLTRPLVLGRLLETIERVLERTRDELLRLRSVRELGKHLGV